MPQTAVTEKSFQLLPLARVFASPLNNRQRFDEAKMQELVESVKADGVITPILVRPANGKFEIAAGERRYRAAKMAGLDLIPAIVREMEDTKFLEFVSIENLLREDVHPLDECLGYERLMKKAGYTVQMVADRVKKSLSYVYGCLKLAELIEPARKLFLEDKITASHAILIARLQPKDQERVLDSHLFVRDWMSGSDNPHALGSSKESDEGRQITRTVSVRELEIWIQQNLLLNLLKAPWKKDDAELYPEAGPCTTCPKRAANQPALFADVGKGDVCTDGHCFGRKLSLYVDQRRKEVEAKTGKPALKLTREYGRGAGKDVIQLNDWSSEKKEIKKDSCKSAQPGVIVRGRGVGQVAWVCLDKGCKVHRSPAQRETPEYLAKQKERHKQEQLKELVRFRLAHSVLDRFDGNLTPRILQIVLLELVGYLDNLDLFARQFEIRVPAYSRGDGPVEKRILAMKTGELGKALLVLACNNYITDSNRISPANEKRLWELAGLVGIDPKKIEAEEKVRVKEREKLGLKAGTCRVCQCTEEKPCKPPCSWVDPTETLCNNPKCVKAVSVQTSAKGKNK